MSKNYIYKFIFDCYNGNKILRRKEGARGRWKELSYEEYCKETGTNIEFQPSHESVWSISFNSKVFKRGENNG